MRALISVYDKTGIIDVAADLSRLGWDIVSSGGTATALRHAGVDVTAVEDITHSPEMLDGRVKTLHPAIHGGILADRSKPAHLASLEEQGITPIDLVICNLYPFRSDPSVELIDIGGPTMVRAAAKNHESVGIVVDPSDYPTVIDELSSDGSLSDETRRRLARTAFAYTAAYDAAIVEWLDGDDPLPPTLHLALEKADDCRYGENPHQSAALYKESSPLPSEIISAKQLQGKELSFNNFIDLNAAWELVKEFDNGAVVIIKHTNPCGVAIGEDQLTTFIGAREVDPVSAFGGILGFNRPITPETAEEILKNFVEAVVAPGFDPEALKLFTTKKNVRLMQMPEMGSPADAGKFDLKRIGGGMLVQSRDTLTYVEDQLKEVSTRKPDDREMEDMKFAWVVAKHVKSNAIVYAKEQEILGIGAGQMSRVDSARVAIEKARKPLQGAVMASDAFFPFRDSVDEAAKNGITAIISPGGSVRDEEVLQAANEHKIAMVFTGTRHFKH